MKIKLSELKTYIGKEIELQGFVDNIRDMQYVQFLILKDRCGKVQVTLEKDGSLEELNKIVSSLPLESTVKIVGKVIENEKVKMGGVEVIPSSIEITSSPTKELPFNYKDKTNVNLDTRLDNRMVDLRNEENLLIFQIQSTFVNAMRNFLVEQDFTELHFPKLISAASESGSEVFEVKYFDRLAYLAQSPQFYKQMAMASGFERVFEVAPCFRAENSNTSRHTTEFTSFDLEISYIKDFHDVMNLESEMLVHGLKVVKEKWGEKIKEVFGTEVIVPTLPFPTIALPKLYEELKQRYNYEMPSEDQGDLNAEAEKLTAKFAMEEYGHEFIFVTDYDAKKRAFYHMRENGVPQGFDLIWRGVEITTGAQREHRYEILKQQAEEKGLAEDVKFYLDFFAHGCPPHGGLAIGVDRITYLLLSLPTIKESMFLFRGPTRLNP